jgi:hypothetical protein
MDVRIRPRSINSVTGTKGERNGFDKMFCQTQLTVDHLYVFMHPKDLQMVNMSLRILSKPSEERLPTIFKVSLYEVGAPVAWLFFALSSLLTGGCWIHVVIATLTSEFGLGLGGACAAIDRQRGRQEYSSAIQRRAASDTAREGVTRGMLMKICGEQSGSDGLLSSVECPRISQEVRKLESERERERAFTYRQYHCDALRSGRAFCKEQRTSALCWRTWPSRISRSALRCVGLPSGI